MTGPTPAAASRELRNVLQRALSCVSSAVAQTEVIGPTTLLNADSRLQRRAGGHIRVFVLHDFVAVSDADQPRSERWQTRTAGYQYRLEDDDGRETLAYYWHPQGQSHVSIPHLHLGAALGTLRMEMVKAHLHTGIVTPVAILALAVEAFGASPRRTDWAEVFEQTARALATG